MNQRIRIGNQTSVNCADRMEPFRYALDNGFDAFEWFADKKWNGAVSRGWDEADMDRAAREGIRETGRSRGVRFTVHAPWQANPLNEDGRLLLHRSVDFARDIGADLVNLHLYTERGPADYARSLAPVLDHAAHVGLRISIENTPHTTPGDFNATFERFAELMPQHKGRVGMCLDIGHANLCGETHNDYVRYMDRLSPAVPIIHCHVHENRGDADTHLTLFTGPSASNDAGVRAFIKRLRARNYDGVLIMEQWPNPPRLLVEAAHRLWAMLEFGR